MVRSQHNDAGGALFAAPARVVPKHVIVSGQQSTDPLTRIFLVNLAAPEKEILEDFQRALRQVRGKMPRSNVNRRLLLAVKFKLDTNCKYSTASRRFFGTPKRADAIRYWRNKAANGKCNIDLAIAARNGDEPGT